MSEKELSITGEGRILSLASIGNDKMKDKLTLVGRPPSGSKEHSLKSQNNKEQMPVEITPIQDLIAGGVAGTASVIVGHPFDTKKVRLQLGSKTGSFTSLFRGMAAPMSTAAMVNAIVFSSFGWSSRIWDQTTALEPYKPYKTFTCGSFAGLMQCLVICPMEHLKCRLQIQNNSKKSLVNPAFRGPIQLTNHIINQHGFFTLYRGWTVTCLREVPAFGLYFVIYDTCKEEITRKFFHPNHPHIWVASALAGGISGISTWMLVYPVDVIKTRIQTSSFDSMRLQDRKIWHAGKQIIRERGLRSMFNGLGVTVARAFPVNGIIFPVYEFTLSKLTT